MILSELYKLYNRLIQDPECRECLPQLGMSSQKISFIVILTPEGKLLDIQDGKIEVTNGKKTSLTPRNLLVPGGAHSSGDTVSPRLLWDKIEYIFGYCNAKEKIGKATQVLFPAFREAHRELREKFKLDDPGLNAVIAFLDSWDPMNIPEEWRVKIEAYGDNFGVFKIQGQKGYVYESPTVMDACLKYFMATNEKQTLGMCLITGERDVPIVRTVETKVKLGEKGGAIATFNATSYESYGKEQTFNAPLSEMGAFKAYNALNFLLGDKRYNIRLGDTTVVFWTDRPTSFDDCLSEILGGASASDLEAMDTVVAQKVQAFWEIVRNAKDPSKVELANEVTTPFYMLGISPNAARIVIRFWHESTLGDLILKLHRYAEETVVEKQFPGDPDHISLYKLLSATVRQKQGAEKPSDPPPLLAGAVLRSVIGGTLYPQSLYQLVLNRINVAHDVGNTNAKSIKVGKKVSYTQAAIVKAFLLRNKNMKGVTMALNPDNKTPAYLLGRLFATLEKTQGDALGDVNAGIADKYYSSAAATPRVVFPLLLDLFRKHLKKLAGEKPSYAISKEKLVGEILDSIDATVGFPNQLSLEERGLFALGYYQQMRVFFTKKDGVSEEETVES